MPSHGREPTKDLSEVACKSGTLIDVVRHRILTAFVLASIAILAGCKSKPSEEAAKKEKTSESGTIALSETALRAAKLSTGKPSLEAKRTSVTAAGTIDFVPDRVARIGTQIPGRVAKVLVALGQTIPRGTAVVMLDSVDVVHARAEFFGAESRFRQTEAEVLREERMVAGGASSERALIAAKTQRDVAAADKKAAEGRLQTLGAASNGTTSTLPLTSPLAGRVLEVRARVGQPVASSDTLVVVGEIDSVWLAVDLYERDVAKIHVGDDVRASTVAYPGRVFQGKVDQLGTIVDPVRRALEARIVLQNPDGALRPGMTSTVRILSGTTDDGGTVLTVPRGAVQAIDGLPYVFVEHGPGKFELRAIERGADIEGAVEVLRGLTADETIVVDGTFILKSEVLREQMGAND